MALIIESPNEVYSLENNENKKLFLAGGITDCPDWQSVVIDKVKDIPNLTIYNPRRKEFPKRFGHYIILVFKWFYKSHCFI